MALTITEMAARLGVRSDTLRYYERTRLISSAGRTSGGYRVYDDNVVDRVRFIKAAQRSGLRLWSIAELLAISDSGNCPCGHTADLVRQRIAEVDAEINDLQALRDKLVRLGQENEACRTLSVAAWSCRFTSSEKGGEAS
jgi:DNA-binding transcriptional MerR regulator